MENLTETKLLGIGDDDRGKEGGSRDLGGYFEIRDGDAVPSLTSNTNSPIKSIMKE